MEPSLTTAGRSSINFKSVASWILIGLVFLLPLAFIPNPAYSFQFTKTALIAFATCVSLAAFVLAALSKGSFRFSKSFVILGVWLVPLTALVSAFFSSTPMLSFFGYELDPDTVAFMAVLALLATLVANLFENRAYALRAQIALLVSGWLCMVFEAVRLFSHGSLLSFGIFSSTLGNPTGSWNDVAIILGLIVTLCLISLEALSFSLLIRVSLVITVVTALCFLAVVNFLPVWVLVALIALGAFFYGFTRQKGVHEHGRRVSLLALLVLLVSLFFIFSGSGVSSKLATYFGTGQIEARPSLQSTLAIGSQVYATQAFLGSGPNTFRTVWDQFHPAEINTTVFWNADFGSGIGFIPTSFVTGGLLEGAAWLFLLLVFCIIGIRVLLTSAFSEHQAYYFSVSSFFATFYILALATVYVPGPAVLGLGFIFLGMFVASLSYRTGALSAIEISVSRNSRLGFLSALILIILMVASIAGVAFVGKAYASAVRFGAATLAAGRGDVAGVLNEAGAANELLSEDRYTRLIASAYVSRLSDLITSTTNPTQTEQDAFRTNLAAAIENALTASKYNPNDYRNWLTLASVYHTVVPLKIQGAYEYVMKNKRERWV